MKNNLSYSRKPTYISEDEERILYEQMKAGDDDARDELIMGHRYLVFKIAGGYSNCAEYEDLVQEGFVGLIRAVDKYDIDKGRLRTYSDRSIRTSILRYLDKNRHIIRLPEPQTYALLNLLKIKDALEIEHRRMIGPADLMENEEVIELHKVFQKSRRSKFSLKEFVHLIDFAEHATSLNAPITEDCNLIVEDTIEDKSQNKEFDLIDTRDLLMKVMQCLSDRERFILAEVSNGASGQQIGDKLGITTQAVSMAKMEAIRKVKRRTKNNKELNEIIEELGFKI